MQDSSHIGTSGWNYKHWSNGVFYPPKLKPAEWLPYYAQFFDTVEVNNTFYGLPKHETFEKWRTQTPDGFRFVLKVSRFYTHQKRLLDPQEHITQFLEAAAGLGDRLSVLLFQLPKGWGFRPDRLEGLLTFMQSQTIMPGTRSALEIRDPTWNTELCFELLRAHNAALVFADWPGLTIEGPLAADFVYMRRHGPGALYASGYPEERLKQDATNILKWRSQGIGSYEFFNNDGFGHAIRDATRLKEMLSEK